MLAHTAETRNFGYTPGRFSVNVKGGRYESCEGDGVRKVEMHFLAKVASGRTQYILDGPTIRLHFEARKNRVGQRIEA